MNTHPIIPVQITPEAHLISSFWKEPAAPVGVGFNTMVLASREPVVFDTGVAADRDGWLAAVSSVVDPDDVRWIVLTHDDHDHTGNLAAALDVFPHATAVTNWWFVERLVGTLELDPRRQRWVAHGETLDIGDRTLVFDRPPIFDSPTTRAVFDPTTGLYWGGDVGAAVGPDPITFAEDVPADEHAQSFLEVHKLISPWVDLVDRNRYQGTVDRLAGFDIRTWASTHGPVYRGPFVDHALDLLRQVPDAPTPETPGQADLDTIVASLLTPA
jgi:flavorubredoxin